MNRLCPRPCVKFTARILDQRNAIENTLAYLSALMHEFHSVVNPHRLIMTSQLSRDFLHLAIFNKVKDGSTVATRW